jgi:hypothetical protein
MEFRCQLCGHLIVLNGPPIARELPCPSCGAMASWPPPPTQAAGTHRPPVAENRPRSRRRMLRRALDPIPRPLAYLVGAVAILLLLSPFWILWLKDALEHERPLVTDGAGSTPLPSSTDTSTPSPVLGETGRDIGQHARRVSRNPPRHQP